MLKKLARGLKILYLPMAAVFIGSVFTSAYFASSVSISSNTFSTGAWTPTPVPTPTPTVGGAAVVINEVYYNVHSDHGDDGDSANPDEWVELYNNTDNPVNLKDWSIQDNSDARTISHANLYIPANGFAIIAKSANTWSYWSVPASAQKIHLGQKIGNGLANTGDRLILKDAGGAIVDQISYGSDATILSPSISSAAKGQSIGRSPDGQDADSAADFTIFNNPTPGGPNV